MLPKPELISHFLRRQLPRPEHMLKGLRLTCGSAIFGQANLCTCSEWSRLCTQAGRAAQASDVCACPQNLCNLIWGMARLAEHPGPELMRKFLQKSEELLDSANQEDEEEKGQGVANTLWALAVLDELRPEFVEQVRAPGAPLRTAPPPFMGGRSPAHVRPLLTGCLLQGLHSHPNTLPACGRCRGTLLGEGAGCSGMLKLEPAMWKLLRSRSLRMRPVLSRVGAQALC